MSVGVWTNITSRAEHTLKDMPFTTSRLCAVRKKTESNKQPVACNEYSQREPQIQALQ